MWHDSLSKDKDGDSRCEKEKGREMTSKEEKSTTFTLEDGTFIFVESSRRDNVERSTDKDGISHLQVKGSILLEAG